MIAQLKVTPGRALIVASALVLAGCDGGLDLGGGPSGFNLAGDRDAARTAPRPEPDGRGVITYPNYQVVLARRGDTVADLAMRIGLTPRELADYNGLSPASELREGELLALPRKIAPGTGGTGGIDIETLANNAINTADSRTATPPPAGTPGVEPVRHRVERGETAYSIARLYDVSVTALARWNRLGTDLSVREGQLLLIPIVEATGEDIVDDSRPGKGSTTPPPPSAAKPLPRDVTAAPLPPSPGLGDQRTTGGDRKFLMPVQGDIIQPYSGKAGGNEGIDIGALPGTAVKAAEDGEIALISKSVGANTIVLVRHDDNIYTVYSNVADVKLAKGDKVKRGQPLGVVAPGSPSYLHFEVRRGTESVDPAPFL
ncbi:MAG: peptidoglycan DD-metalloendopeptidase family protein [Rhodobacteraceae bacterium]|nr:peptidoglycan DD-metalloendopeptidase family protein [Paracoccaceae bacterium]